MAVAEAQKRGALLFVTMQSMSRVRVQVPVSVAVKPQPTPPPSAVILILIPNHSAVGGSDIPGPYGSFLQSINIFTLDAFQLVPFDCVQSLNHLDKLLMETLVPMGILLLVLAVKITPLVARGQSSQAFARMMSLLAGFLEILVFFLPNMYGRSRAPPLPCVSLDIHCTVPLSDAFCITLRCSSLRIFRSFRCSVYDQGEGKKALSYLEADASITCGSSGVLRGSLKYSIVSPDCREAHQHTTALPSQCSPLSLVANTCRIDDARLPGGCSFGNLPHAMEA